MHNINCTLYIVYSEQNRWMKNINWELKSPFAGHPDANRGNVGFRWEPFFYSGFALSRGWHEGKYTSCHCPYHHHPFYHHPHLSFALFWSWRITYRRSIELRSLDPNPDDILTFQNFVWIQSSPQICNFLPVYSLYHLPWYLPQHVLLNYVPNGLSVPLTTMLCGHREKCAPKLFCQLIRFWSFQASRHLICSFEPRLSFCLW